jgi:hypothetical protein
MFEMVTYAPSPNKERTESYVSWGAQSIAERSSLISKNNAK